MIGTPFEDAPAAIDVHEETLIHQGFRRFERYELTLHPPASRPVRQTREILRVGGAAGILAIDPVRQAIVLIRQFRLTAHFSTGRGELIEIPAGLIDPGEDPAITARRECIEEIGLDPGEVHFLFSSLVSPGALDETAWFYLGFVDASHLPEQTGVEGENEVIRPFLVPLDEAIAALDDGRQLASGYLRMGLMWIALHRAEVTARGEAWLARRGA
ncbi:hypothetical protein GCM10007301_41190 [Azorhizobium oxalatiphilum]|uniref:GDP-mannose pyrophosphatase n=1 Tax=Azorhizobium oxalatiphilum TaxID=980631 RepID=A0A917FEW7_9HYPH|nr:NUDIX hydrolase [Azorhizobium oxalatiphilum]GGF77027.1 hypothetical protein GCM10007301_41190 [Azorhizobium oxalatiphilum]